MSEIGGGVRSNSQRSRDCLLDVDVVVVCVDASEMRDGGGSHIHLHMEIMHGGSL